MSNNTFYVRTANKVNYVAAKFLTDNNGNFVTSANQEHRDYRIFDSDRNQIGLNTNGYIIVPADFNMKTVVDFGASLFILQNPMWNTPQTALGSAAVANAVMAYAFWPGGSLDIQTNYNGVTGDNVPAFQDGASYIYGAVGRAAGYSLEMLKFSGGVVNTIQSLRQTDIKMDGAYYNNLRNVNSMADGLMRLAKGDLAHPPQPRQALLSIIA